MAGIKRFIVRKCKLNENKSQVSKTDQANFLLFALEGSKIRWSDKAFAEFKRRLKLLTEAARGSALAPWPLRPA
jgi:RNA-directed DNA polymerase